MDEIPDPNRLSRAIRALTVAVWCLCALSLGQLGLYIYGFVQAASFTRQASHTVLERSSSSQPPVAAEPNFHELPPDQMVKRASVILLTTYRKDGEKNRAMITEVLKRTPNTLLYHALGEEYGELSMDSRPDVSCGDGQVVFMVGSPASMRYACSYANGRIQGLGDMPLQTLRDTIRETK
jgi:hypothetical protein